MDYINLSKTILYILKYGVDEAKIQPDSNGWVNINDLILEIKNNSKKYSNVSKDDIINVVNKNKKRYELNEDKIRLIDLSKKLKMIIILFDYTNENVKSYVETLNEMKNETELIITNCLNFFSFNTLNKGYDVKIIKENKEYILLSELLNNDKLYCDKEIKKYHRVEGLLLADKLNFKKE